MSAFVCMLTIYCSVFFGGFILFPCRYLMEGYLIKNVSRRSWMAV